MVRQKLKFLAYAPIVFLSALTGYRIDKLYTIIDRVAQARNRRVSTGEMNPLAGKSRSGPRHFSRQPPDQNLLHDAGDVGATDVRPVHESDKAASFQLPALP